MPEDPRALKICIDGNAYRNPGGPGGCAGLVVYPDDWNKQPEEIFRVGFHHTTNNRAELMACIRAFEYVRDRAAGLRVQRVLIITDSQYVCRYLPYAVCWRDNGWKTADGRRVENVDLWKKLLSLRSKLCVRTEVVWKQGKSSATADAVDKAAKQAGKEPTRTDWGFRQGKVGRSKVKGGSSQLFPAHGQEEAIYIYRSGMVGKTENKVFFNLCSEGRGEFSGKYRAFAGTDVAAELHRGHSYRVRFNSNSGYPIIEAIVETVIRDKDEQAPGGSEAMT